MGTTFRPYQPDQMQLLPQDLREWVPEGHLAHHVSDLVDALDLSPFYAPYEGDGRRNSPYDPRMMVKVLVYGEARREEPNRHPRRDAPDSLGIGELQVHDELPTLAGHGSSDHGRGLFPTYFGSDVALVPAPGHAPRAEGDEPRSTTIELVRSMEAEGLGRRREWLHRLEKVPKSAWSRGTRPTEERHHATIALAAPPVLGLDPVGRITVVDDVITSGATLHACVRRLAEAFPSADVAAFAIVRMITGLPQLSKAFDPVPEGKGTSSSTPTGARVRHERSTMTGACKSASLAAGAFCSYRAGMTGDTEWNGRESEARVAVGRWTPGAEFESQGCVSHGGAFPVPRCESRRERTRGSVNASNGRRENDRWVPRRNGSGRRPGWAWALTPRTGWETVGTVRFTTLVWAEQTPLSLCQRDRLDVIGRSVGRPSPPLPRFHQQDEADHEA